MLRTPQPMSAWRNRRTSGYLEDDDSDAKGWVNRLRTDLVPRRIFGEIFDAARLTRWLVDRDYWDPRHFHAHVYNHLNAALLRQLYGPPMQCDDFNHGKCSKAKHRPLLARVKLSANVVAESGSTDGWAGVSQRPPHKWSALQTMLWIDSLGVEYDAKVLATRELNGTGLLELVEQARGAELGISSMALRQVLSPRLRQLDVSISKFHRARSTSSTQQVHVVSSSRS